MLTALAPPRSALPRAPKALPRDDITCPECGQRFPVTTPEGFTVCSACGCEYPGSQPYVCTDPLARGGRTVQAHMVMAPHTRRTIGTPAERATLPRALAWGERVAVTYEQEVFLRAYFEVRKILAQLAIEGRDTLFDAAMAGFARAYRASPKGSRCHNVHLLALVATYRALRAAKVPAVMKHYLETCLDHGQFPTQAFYDVFQATARAFPRPPQGEILRAEAAALASRLQLPPAIQSTLGTVLRLHAGAFCSGKTAVRAAATTGAAVLIAGARAQFPLSVIARSAGVAASAVIRCLTEACARAGHPLAGSVVNAGPTMQTAFLAPKTLKTLAKAKIPTPAPSPEATALAAAAPASPAVSATAPANPVKVTPAHPLQVTPVPGTTARFAPVDMGILSLASHPVISPAILAVRRPRPWFSPLMLGPTDLCAGDGPPGPARGRRVIKHQRTAEIPPAAPSIA